MDITVILAIVNGAQQIIDTVTTNQQIMDGLSEAEKAQVMKEADSADQAWDDHVRRAKLRMGLL